MKQAVVLLMVVALAAIGSGKPLESNRKPSSVNQYPFYGPNFLYGTDRISDELLKRLFAKRLEDSYADVPFVHVPGVSPNDRPITDADERLWQLLLPQGKPLDDRAPEPIEEPESDAEKPIGKEQEKPEQPDQQPKEDNREPEEKQPQKPDQQPEGQDNGKEKQQPIEKEQEKPEKSNQQPEEKDGEKEKQQQKPDQPPKESDKEKEKQQQNPDRQPKEDNKEKEKQQQKPDQQPKEDDKRKEKQQDGKVAKPSDSEKRDRPGQPMIPQPKEGNRPGGRKPSEDLARRPGKDDLRGDREKPESPKPELPPRRPPQLPLVQINVNVAAPVL